MKLTVLMPCRNEDWIVGLSARVALLWCDDIIILDHASDDGTHNILLDLHRDYPGRVTLIEEKDPDWKEMEHRQLLLNTARQQGATHMAIVDADEILTANLLPHIRQAVQNLKPCEIMRSAMFAMWRDPYHYRTDGRTWANRNDLTLAFCDHPSLRWHAPSGYDHHHREPYGARTGLTIGGNRGVMHLQFADWERLKAKHARYKMMERIKYPQKPVREIDRLYSLAIDEEGLQLQAAHVLWWAGYEKLAQEYLKLGQVPWQTEECQRMLKEKGREYFVGLDPFGIV